MTALDRLSIGAIADGVRSGRRPAAAVIADVLARLAVYDPVQSAVWIARYDADAFAPPPRPWTRVSPRARRCRSPACRSR